MRGLLLIFLMSMLKLIANAQLDSDALKYDFAKLDSFLIDFYKTSQFREPADDTLSLRMLAHYKDFFKEGLEHPDLINPTLTSRGELIMPSRIVNKSVETFVSDIKANFPKGVFVKIRALNADYSKIDKGSVAISLERKLWGEVRNRWSIELLDTVLLTIDGVHDKLKISRFKTLGHGYILTDVKKIGERTKLKSIHLYQREVQSEWEVEHLKRRRRMTIDEMKSANPILSDSIDQNNPCTSALRVFFFEDAEKDLPQELVETHSINLKTPMIVFNDRFGNYSVELPSPNADIYRDLPFLQPFLVIDSSSSYYHIVEYVPNGFASTTGQILKCLEDYGWIKKSRLLKGSHCLRDKNTLRPLRVFSEVGNVKSKYSRHRFFESPALMSERRINERETSILYIYQRQGRAVLVGTKQRASVRDMSEVILGWVDLTEILGGLYYE